MNLNPTQFKIDKIMADMPLEWRYRWCEAKLCCCLGCANVSGRLKELGFNKGDWAWWCRRNPEPKKDEYERYIK